MDDDTFFLKSKEREKPLNFFFQLFLMQKNALWARICKAKKKYQSSIKCYKMNLNTVHYIIIK